jgi:O-antigen ligase
MTRESVRTTALGLSAGAVVGLIAARAPDLLTLALIAVLGLTLGRRPALLLGLFLVIDQTYAGTRYYAQIGKLVTTGHQFYEPIKGVSPAPLLLLLGLAMQLYTGRGIAAAKLHTHGLDGVGAVLVALVLWTMMLSLAQEQADFSAGSFLRIATNMLAAVLPWLLCLGTYALAIRMLREPGGRRQLARVIAGALILKGALGLVVLLTTHGAVVDNQRYVVYYDAALPMVAGMTIVAFLLASRHAVPWRKVILFLAGTIVVFSFRRSVWSAMAVAVVILPLVRQRTVVLRRVLAVATLSMLVVLVMPASTKQAAFSRVGSAVSVAQGTGDEESAQYHKRDVERGYRIAQENVWKGIGVRAPQRREFAYQQSKTLYVHNDPLQVWLRLGLPGISLYLMLLAVLSWRGIATLRRGGTLSVLDAGCAAFAVVCVFALMSAPFASDTTRWPVLLGVVAAVLRTSATDARDAAKAAAVAGRRSSSPSRVEVPV